ncbi:unnamed protein product [Vitrella brassicaformis CCMP3155]|uniref:Selenoprotein F/M domain-containing protein n=1 Tax=Vitrella brassicaformis (strain CCMP3155) TaxID=1169540 RepID=A0A0G4EDY1_VITBC|nr:unnamed protein product [Vitrella brassicaformis CCMP3155]|eukprot:CEL93770.1 unnamed protein product [Vitrella brassicaformis CCMP3155]
MKRRDLGWAATPLLLALPLCSHYVIARAGVPDPLSCQEKGFITDSLLCSSCARVGVQLPKSAESRRLIDECQSCCKADNVASATHIRREVPRFGKKMSIKYIRGARTTLVLQRAADASSSSSSSSAGGEGTDKTEAHEHEHVNIRGWKNDDLVLYCLNQLGMRPEDLKDEKPDKKVKA